MNNINENDIPEIDLIHIFELLLMKIWIIVISGLIGAGILFYYSSTMIKPRYQSSAMFYVNNNNLNIGSTSFSISSADISASQSLVDTYVSILRTRNTLETVIEKNNLDYSYNQLLSMISTSSVNSTEIFRVTVTSTDPVEACKIANGISEILPDKISEIVTGSGAKIVDYAVVNPQKVYPSVTKYTIIGLLVGAALAALIIILRDLFDDTIYDDTYLLNAYDEIATLAVIPNLDGKHSSSYYYKSKKNYGYDYEQKDSEEKEIEKSIKKDKKKKKDPNMEENVALLCESMHFDAKEAYKLLRTNVMFTLPDNTGCRTLGITSPIRGEGKSTVAINLAYTFAATNSRVLLIDMDMRLPSIATKLEVQPKKGLSDYLINNATLEEIVFKMKKYTNWDVIFSGSIPPTPAELIGSKRMKQLIAKLEKEYDYIIIDLPPVNVVSDALVAKELVSGLLITVREGYSDKRSLADCMRQLGFLEANVPGFVVTDSSDNIGTYGKKYRNYYRYYRKKKYGYYTKHYGYYSKNYGYDNNSKK